MTPEAAAALILQYDGDVTAIPFYVTTLTAQPLGPGFQVTTTYFYVVPQKTGDLAVVRIQDGRLEQVVRRAFAAAGGQRIVVE
ncbi:MAG: hypothetical protein AAGI03_13145 [Pseudomonadota bacterium]